MRLVLKFSVKFKFYCANNIITLLNVDPINVVMERLRPSEWLLACNFRSYLTPPPQLLH